MDTQDPQLADFFDEPVATDKELDATERFAHSFIAKGHAKYNGVNYSESDDLPLTVKANLARVQKKYSDRFDVSTENVLAEYAKMAFFNMHDIFDKDGKLLPVHELDTQVSACITGLTVTQVGGSEDGWITDIKYKFADKLKALDSLGRNLSLFKDNINLDHSGSIDTDVSDNEKTRRVAFLVDAMLRARTKNSGKPG